MCGGSLAWFCVCGSVSVRVFGCRVCSVWAWGEAGGTVATRFCGDDSAARSGAQCPLARCCARVVYMHTEISVSIASFALCGTCWRASSLARLHPTPISKFFFSLSLSLSCLSLVSLLFLALPRSRTKYSPFAYPCVRQSSQLTVRLPNRPAVGTNSAAVAAWARSVAVVAGSACWGAGARSIVAELA